MANPLRLGAGAAFAALALTACAGSASTESAEPNPVLDFAQQAREAGYEDQYSILSDGTVSRAEYETAVDAALSCNREVGRETYEPWINPVDGITIMYDFLPGEGIPVDGPGADIDCETQHVIYVSSAYQAVNPAVMDEPLRQNIRECATDAGLNTTGGEMNVADFIDSVGESNSQALLDCVSAGLKTLYPDQPLYSYGY